MTQFWSQALYLEPSSASAGDEFRKLSGKDFNVSLQRSRTPVRLPRSDASGLVQHGSGR